MKTVPTALAFLCLVLAARAELRTWTDASGKFQIKAELVGVQAGQATLKREDGSIIRIPVANLSKADQAALGGGASGGAGGAAAGDWPQWRGPNRDDVSKETGLLKKWPSDGPKRAWVNEDAGLGYSGFAVAGGKLYTLGLYDTDEKVVCLDAATGKKVWDTTIGSIYNNNWGNGPRSTPTVANGMVYALGANGDLACLNAETGKKEWDKSLTKDFGGKLQSWGYTESPLVDGDQVVVTPGGEGGAIVALDSKSGATKWKTKDLTDNAQYSSIIVIEPKGQKQYVQLLMNTIVGVSPKDGAIVWKSDFPGRTAVIPTPIYKDNHIYVTAGYGVGCKMIKLTDGVAQEVYSNKNMVNHHGGVLLVGDHLYGHSDSGGWTCQHFATGEVVWKDKGIGKGAVAFADGMLYCQAENDGTIALVEASKDGWKMVSSFKLEAQSSQRKPQGKIWTHPVIAGGKLFLRDQEFISCYDIKG
ncbi:MAG TPA: PQQ-binding-like beta-propeller repeat protein [Prosthecobacter sp.]